MLEKLLEPVLSQSRDLRGCSCTQHTAGDTRALSQSSSARAKLETLVPFLLQLPGHGRDPITTLQPPGWGWTLGMGTWEGTHGP